MLGDKNDVAVMASKKALLLGPVEVGAAETTPSSFHTAGGGLASCATVPPPPVLLES